MVTDGNLNLQEILKLKSEIDIHILTSNDKSSFIVTTFYLT
jgi:hypothetical protein